MEHENVRQRSGDWYGFSLRSLGLILVGLILFAVYISVLLYGENSLSALNKLHRDKEHLLHEARRLRQSNQKLQKEFFELIQLSGS